MASSQREEMPIYEYSAIFALALVVAIPRSYANIKIVSLVFFLLTAALYLIRVKKFEIDYCLINYFGMVSFIGVIWSFVGMTNSGSLIGIYEQLRLYVGWSFSYLIISAIVSELNGMRLLHKSFVFGSLIIVGLNITGAYDFIYGAGLINDNIKNELEMFIGVHDGYMQITSNNIGGLFFLMNYFSVIAMHKSTPSTEKLLSGFVFWILMIVCILSGRRALWLSVLISLVMIFIHGYFSKNSVFDQKKLRTVYIYGLLALTIFLIYIVIELDFSFDSTVEHVYDAFSSEDERSKQAPYLIDGFLSNIIFGSGFGVELPYIRNFERPWIYELTFHQILFNFGIIGSVVIMAVGFIYINLTVKTFNSNNEIKRYGLAMLYGCFGFAVGCYSNPYLGSFDFMIYTWVLPIYLASYNKIMRVK